MHLNLINASRNLVDVYHNTLVLKFSGWINGFRQRGDSLNVAVIEPVIVSVTPKEAS